MNDPVILRQKQLLESIQVLFESAERYFNLLENGTQDALFFYHAEGASVNHCIRWGLQATYDVLKNWDGFVNRMKERGAI